MWRERREKRARARSSLNLYVYIAKSSRVGTLREFGVKDERGALVRWQCSLNRERERERERERSKDKHFII